MNGNSESEVKKKRCPFLNEYCIGDKCAIYTQLLQNVGGTQRTVGLCPISAFVLLISEINQKTQPPQQKIELPNLFRGKG